ncbi:hypothetical protein DCO58_09680 [Helicobacter saguini]|uniref:PEP-utilising enzyme mobile domain-containing protein n=1 Tax=Helicobacter saguini TaxID=1548018 RepID=A0A347VPD1_9HELI|nr:PEP-utilizing enzyme [Helicobacter saguini]MWV61413.1 hypothetical protein [Helicobacter saguini]MWV67917.1 hypothetical protein [Helicobacter saguini]MWV70615.1 hypothetical protein [Helicobacter saguini]MWV72520.1 hypothetical protein [Helicobacter saguini]TLD94739.1 hypothetical protein LS64_004255 [Helicobacter saguini]
MKLESKALNLLNLSRLGLKSAKIAPLFITNFKEFMESKERVLDSIAKLKAKKLIIRSSSSSEDSAEKSNAGAFLSIANVDSSDSKAICEAIKKVADSMPSKTDSILIQEMLENITMCGVAFSVDKDNLSPYFCVQYDKSGSHDSVTSGSSNDIISYFEYRNVGELPHLDSKKTNVDCHEFANVNFRNDIACRPTNIESNLKDSKKDSKNLSPTHRPIINNIESKNQTPVRHPFSSIDFIESSDIAEMKQVINLIKELESIYKNHFLDIEFAFVETKDSNFIESKSQDSKKDSKKSQNLNCKDSKDSKKKQNLDSKTQMSAHHPIINNVDSKNQTLTHHPFSSVDSKKSAQRTINIESKSQDSILNAANHPIINNIESKKSTKHIINIDSKENIESKSLSPTHHPIIKNTAHATKTLYLLQVRSIVTKNKQNLFDKLPADALFRLYKRFNSLQTKRPHILGDRAIFGVMPDWNPAEIIGLRPKRLAFSLYKEIITDSIWAYQRDNYGYKDLRSHPLMHSFLGIPYIDVRLSFNSFIPKKLDSKIAEKLVNYYINTLAKNPNLHDKVEFEIVFSCYDLNAAAKLKRLQNHGFNDNEIKRLEFSLLELTNSILNEQNGLYKRDMERVARLDSKFASLKDSNLSPYDKIYWLLEECKRYGTLPFAGVARAGFVAMQLLNSLVEIGFLSVDEKNAFLNSLHTISKNLSLKISHLDSKNKAAFLREFGHLRAGTYNILSPRYDEAFESYFEIDSNVIKGSIDSIESKPTKNLQNLDSKKPFKLDSKRLKKLDNLLRENGLLITADGLFSFFKKAIEGREYAKFKFSKLLSYAIVVIGQLGAHYDISKEDMAHLDIQDIRILYANLFSQSPKVRFLEQIAANKQEYELTNAVKLPELLCEKSQIFHFFATRNMANFITQKSITAKVALESSKDLSGKIVLIKSADPGYDYIFTKNIAGFITCYGGANSHMAIRASELALPAVIGVGEEAFNLYTKAKKLQINAQEKQILAL